MSQNLFEDEAYQSANPLLDYFLNSIKKDTNKFSESLFFPLEKFLPFGFHQHPE